MGTFSKVRDNSQKIIWAFLIIFILSMAAGGLMGGFNLVSQFKEWIGFNTSDQHAFAIDEERISHQAYASTYEGNSSFGGNDGVNFFSHVASLERFKQRHLINKLYEDIFGSDQVSDVDILTRISSTTPLSQEPNILLKDVLLKGFSEEFTDTNGNGKWDDEEIYIDVNGKWDVGEKFTDTNGNGKWDEKEEFVDVGNGKYDQGETTIDANGNGKWDKAEPFVDVKNKKYDQGEAFVDKNDNEDWDQGEEFTDIKNGTWDSNTEKWISDCIKRGKIDLSAIQDDYLRQRIKSVLNPSSESFKQEKLNSVYNALHYITNDEIDFNDKISNTQITANYIKYDLSKIDEKDIKIDEEKLKSSITPYEKYNSGVSIVTLFIISLLLLIYSYLNRESRAKLSFGGFFLIMLLITTIFKFIDYNKQGTDKVRTISYVYLSKQDFNKGAGAGNGEWDEGEKFIDINGNEKYDKDEKFDDFISNKDFNKTKEDIVKGITKNGFNTKYLEDNNLKDKFSEDTKIVKNFLIDCSIGNVLTLPCEENINNISNFTLLPKVINKAFNAKIGEHFIVEDKSDGEIQNILIGYIHEEENYHEYKEYEKLKKEFIKEEKEKFAKNKLKEVINDVKGTDSEQVTLLFEEVASEDSSLEASIAEGSLSSALDPVYLKNPDSRTNTPGNNGSIIGTLYEMNKDEISDVIFSTDGAYAYVIFMNEKDYTKRDIDYKKEKEQKISTLNRTGITSSEYYRDIVAGLNIADWRDEASISITVDPDSRATKNLTNLYFDFNSYLQLRNALTTR